ncbi:MAG: hypothetical protein FWB99_01560 [Treponema sp.]|nr:hypothetical protein [Treponema sp.]
MKYKNKKMVGSKLDIITQDMVDETLKRFVQKNHRELRLFSIWKNDSEFQAFSQKTGIKPFDVLKD